MAEGSLVSFSMARNFHCSAEAFNVERSSRKAPLPLAILNTFLQPVSLSASFSLQRKKNWVKLRFYNNQSSIDWILVLADFFFQPRLVNYLNINCFCLIIDLAMITLMASGTDPDIPYEDSVFIHDESSSSSISSLILGASNIERTKSSQGSNVASSLLFFWATSRHSLTIFINLVWDSTLMPSSIAMFKAFCHTAILSRKLL